MAKIFDRVVYLTPMESTQILQVSCKTLQRWVEKSQATVSIKKAGNKNIRRQIKIKVQMIQTPTNYRYYRQNDINNLAIKLGFRPPE